MKIKINVTQKNIDEGGRCMALSCPIALALNNVFVPDKMLSTNQYTFHTGNGIDYKLPPEVTKFINNFDDGKKVEPFSFVVEV